MNIPANEQAVMPYLLLSGAEKFIAFTVAVFNAEVLNRMHTPEGNIRHAHITISGCSLMLADATPDYPPCTTGLFVYVTDAKAVWEKALQLGATSVMEPVATPYASCAAGFKDPFGNTWWPATPLN